MRQSIFLVLSIFVITGCASKSIVENSSKSQLELRELQSREVQSADIKFVTKVVFQVLQDDDYVIENLNPELGYFTATKKLDGGKEKYQFKFYDIYYPIAIYKWATLGRYLQEISATISIRVLNDKSKVRASFVAQTKNESGKIVNIKTIDTPQFYQDFFMKVDKAVFLEKNKL